MIKGFTRYFKPPEILTEEQVEIIQRGALDILSETGIRIEHENALKLLEKQGCIVDYDQMRARFPEGLVQECLGKVPGSFRTKARNHDNDIIWGGNTVYFAAGPGMQTVDTDTWEPRVPTKQEYINGVKVVDALDNCCGFGAYTPYFGFEGVPPAMAIPEGLAIRLANANKAMINEATMEECDIFTAKMAKAVGAEFTGAVTGAPPLTFYRDQIEVLFRFVETGFPVMVFHGGHVMGGSGPATLAGSLMLDHAGDMAALALTQLVKPGQRVRQGSPTFPMNMRTGSPSFGGIEVSIFHAAYFQVRQKNMPVPVDLLGGACFSDSKRIDFQCSYEKAIMALTSALYGAQEVVFHGGVYGELTWHPLQAILDDDIAGMIGRFIQGIEVNDETLALDLIEQVGPIPGHYLNTEHTRNWWSREQFMPKAADRLTYPEWIKTGKKSALDYARERMDEILATHKVDPPLTASEEQAIEDILKEAREFYRKQGKISDIEWEAYKKVW
jgi:trimethylamine--corrinoid protein Co-methyltransferase